MCEHDDDHEYPWTNPHCRSCGWVFPVQQEHCPMCGAARPEFTDTNDEE